MKKVALALAVLLITFFLVVFLEAAGQVEDLEARLNKSPDDQALLLDYGRLCHNSAFERNDVGLIEKGDKALSRLLSLDPKNAAAMVYLGSLKTQQANASLGNPAEALGYLQEGFTLMDKAVQSAPDNPEVRLVRGINSTLIPDMFGRLPVALEDFEALEALIARNPSSLPGEQQVTVYFNLGETLMKTGDRPAAEKAFRRVIELDPKSPEAASARERLSRK